MHTTIDCCNFLKMNNLGKKIAEARIAKSLNQSELSRILGVTPQAVQKWEAGTSQPKGSRLKNVADALGLSVSLLLDEERTAPTLIPSGEYKIAGPSSIEPSRNESPNIYAGPDLRGKVPVISWVQAGAFCEAIDNLHTGDAYDWIETSVHVRSHTFALRYRNSRKVLGTVKNVTVSQSCGKWFVSIQTEREIEQPIPTGGAVGIDMGITRFATLSDGSFYAPLNSFKRHETSLRKAQQAMNRKVKFSNNWKKVKARVQKIHSRIGNARRDYLHKTSTAISQNHAMVCIEDLQVRNMSKSAAGTADAPGRNVRAKSGLNKSILDQGWFEFRRQLDYKLAWNGGHLIAVPPQNTSRTCPCCGHISADNRQTQARFECVECGFEDNADVVGAINVLERGHRLLACGELAQSGRSVKQEPAEATTQGFALV